MISDRLCAIYRAVKPRVPYFSLLALLGVLSLLGAQVFGIARGFECDCTGRVEFTQFDHCHGPHHSDCHRDEAPGHQHEEGDDAGERREHQQVRDDVDSRQLPPTMAASRPAVSVTCAS